SIDRAARDHRLRGAVVMLTDTPDLIDCLEQWFLTYSRDLHTAFPARVHTYYPGRNTADLTPMVKGALEDDDGNPVSELLPMLPNVPLLFPRMGDWHVQFPVTDGPNGDWVLVVCCESSIGHLRSTGVLMEPGDQRRHHLSHAVALAGFFPTPIKIAGQ